MPRPGLFVVSLSNHADAGRDKLVRGRSESANNGFTVTLSGSLTGWTSGTAITFGCSGTPGTGSNCIDFAYTIPTVGTYGPTPASLGNCGENNANGNAPYIPAGNPGNGICQTNGVGSLVRNFAIGSNQALWGGGAPVAGSSYYDDGINPNGTEGYNHSAAFTCQIVAAKDDQCVRGPPYVSGSATTIGEWLIRFDLCRAGRQSRGQLAHQHAHGLRGRPVAPDYKPGIRLPNAGALYIHSPPENRDFSDLHFVNRRNRDDLRDRAFRGYGRPDDQWDDCHGQ